MRDIDSVESLENDAYGELRALLRDNGVLLDELGEPDAWDLSQKRSVVVPCMPMSGVSCMWR